MRYGLRESYKVLITYRHFLFQIAVNFTQLINIQKYMIFDSLSKKFYSVYLALALVSISLCDVSYEAIYQCQKNMTQNCISWPKSVSLSLKKNWISTPVHAQQKVLTTLGVKNIEQLKIGDMILGYNHQKGVNQFSALIAWLHKDEKAQMDFVKITTIDKNAFITSSDSNLAVYTSQAKILYKMMQEIGSQQLLLFDKKLKISSIQKNIRKKGLYAPITASGNFYIYPEYSYLQSSLLLINCFANIDSPNQKLKWAYPFINIINKIIGSVEKLQYYEHPLAKLTQYMEQIPKEQTRVYQIVDQAERKRQQQKLKGIQVVIFYLRQMLNLIIFIS